tara:strand:+ start:321 stop:695 length:375 start_codon:yes stop_codon:yes gene_type:complete
MAYSQQALETLLWSSTIYTSEECDGETADHFVPSQDLIDRVDNEFCKFEELLESRLPEFDIVEDCKIKCDEFEQLEHDFILTINGHGAGFWDGDWKSGNMLTEICEGFREIGVYLGDDNLIYPC